MKRLSPGLKLAYGSGTIPMTAQDIAFSFFILFYYRQVLGLSGKLAGLAILIAMVCDAISDLFMGSFSDRFRSRWGRRHPFMVIGMIPLAISFFFLFYPPGGLSQMQLFLWLTVVVVALRTFVTIFFIPYLALGAELTDDYQERSSIGTYRTVFGFLVHAILYWFIMAILFRPATGADGAKVDPRLLPHNYGELALCLCIVVIVFSSISVFFTRKRIPFLPKQSEDAKGFTPLSVVSDMRNCLRCRNFRIMFFVMLTTFAIMGIFMTVVMYLGTYFWELTTEQMSYMGPLIFVAAMLMFSLMGPLGRRFEKQHLLQFAFVAGAINATWFIGLRLLGLLPENGHRLIFTLYLVNVFIRVCCLMIFHIILTSILADIADEQEYETGQRQEGILLATFMFSAKSFTGFGALFGGLLLDFVHLDVTAVPGEVPSDVLFKFGLAVGPIAGCLFMVPFAISRFFTVSRAKHAEIKEALLERKQGTPTPVSEET